MRIFVCTNYRYWEWQPPDMFEPSDHMVAGGETASVNLSVQLAQRGHEVMHFQHGLHPQHYRGVDFFPKELARQMVPSMKADVLIAWEDPEAVSWNHRCDLVIFPMQTNALQIGALDWGIDYYQAVSNWHRETLIASDSSLPLSVRDKFVVIPNGVNLERYAQPVSRIPGRVIYSSSPDRGLHHLLRFWPEIKRQVPHASLRIFYDKSRWEAIVAQQQAEGILLNTTDRAYLVQQGLKAVEGMDVEHVGAVGQWRLAQEQLAASLMCYPMDSVDHATEGFSVSTLEAMAAGCPALISDGDAFKELWTGSAAMVSLPVEGKEQLWVDAAVRLLTDARAWKRQRAAGKKKAATLTWDLIGETYERWLVHALKDKQEAR